MICWTMFDENNHSTSGNILQRARFSNVWAMLHQHVAGPHYNNPQVLYRSQDQFLRYAGILIP